MRRGQDRHELAEEVLELLFPEGTAVLRGIDLGTSFPTVVAREGEGKPARGATAWTWPVTDPFENGRRVELRVHSHVDRVAILSASFYSADKMDVDAPYRLIRKHLKKHHGRPGRSLTGVLTFTYEIDGEYPGVTSISRYKDDRGENVLEVSTRLADGVRFQGEGGKKGLQNASRRQGGGSD